MKVHIFASDLLPLPGLPTSGGGLRSWQLIEGLRAHGLEVSYSMPRKVFLGSMFAEAIPPEERERGWDESNQEALLERFDPEVALWCNAPTLQVRPDWPGRARFLADLHGPINMESVFVTKRTLEDTTRELTGALARYDGFSCVSGRQRYYWTGLLAAAGILIDEVPFAVTPLSVEVERDPGERGVPDELRLIYAGGFYPWQNCMEVLVAIGEELDRAGTGRLDLFGGVHEFSDSPEFQELFARLRTFDRVHLHGFVARDELAAYYRRASAAVDLMHRNIERELAVTTRTAEYLAQGIPPLYNNYNILSDLVRRHEAGWCLDPDDLEGVRRLVRHLLVHHAEEIPRRSANAARIYTEELTVPATTAALAEVCRELGSEVRSGGIRRFQAPTALRTAKPFHKRFYYAWQALSGKRVRIERK